MQKVRKQGSVAASKMSSMCCQKVGRRKRRGESTMRMNACASKGLQDHPKGNLRVDNSPEGDCSTKQPRTRGGKRMDQKQLETSNFVKNRGERGRVNFELGKVE